LVGNIIAGVVGVALIALIIMLSTRRGGSGGG